MDANYYRGLTDETLEAELKKMELELVKSYGQMEVSKIKKNKGEVSKGGGGNISKRIKKEIARIKTIQVERRKLG